jgi:2-C-methyl-D-erythritol 4-phosphate cytidylyltransferase
MQETNLPRVCVLLAAAGAGARLATAANPGADATPKALLALAGKPLLCYALETFLDQAGINEIIVLAPPTHMAQTEACLQQHLASGRVKIIAGGNTRQESVYRGLQAAAPDTEYVIIHDAARPLVSPALIAACLAAAQAHGAAICALPTTDTIKSSQDHEWVEKTLDRSQLWSVQTPQAFQFRRLLEAHETARRQGLDLSDDAGVMEAVGGRVYLVPGSADNIKITRPADFAIAEQLLERISNLNLL